MAAPTYTVIVYFDFPFATSAFTLDDTTRGLLDGTTYKLYASTPTDVTADVTSVSINRGNDSQLFPDVTAGTAVVTLNNDRSCSLGARTYDPMNTSSPYYGNIIPGRRVDIKANGVTVFTGRVQDWNFSFDVNGRSMATMVCADGLATLARQELDTFTATASQATGARISAILDRSEVQWPYARAIDTGASTLQGDTVAFGTNVLQYLNAVVKSDVGLMFVSKDGVLTFKSRRAVLNTSGTTSFTMGGGGYLSLDGTAGCYATVPDSAALDLTGDLEIVARVAATDWTPAANQRIFSKLNGASTAAGGGYELYLSTDGNLQFQWSNGAVSSNVAASATTFVDGATYWVKATFTSSTSTANLYYAADADSEPSSWTLAGSGTGTGSPSANAINGFIGGISGLSREFTGRIYRVIVRNGIAGTKVLDANYDRVTASGQTTLTESSSQGATVTCQGTATTVVPTGIPYAGIETTYGSELLFNRIVVNNNGFASATTLSLASQAIYGIATYSTPTLLLSNSTQMTDMGNWLAGTYNGPEFRVSQLRINVHALSDSDKASVLALDIGSVCTIRFRPNATGDGFTRTALVLGINDQMIPGSQVRTISFGDVDGRAFFVLDNAVYGRLDNNLLAF